MALSDGALSVMNNEVHTKNELLCDLDRKLKLFKYENASGTSWIHITLLFFIERIVASELENEKDSVAPSPIFLDCNEKAFKFKEFFLTSFEKVIEIRWRVISRFHEISNGGFKSGNKMSQE